MDSFKMKHFGRIEKVFSSIIVLITTINSVMVASPAFPGLIDYKQPDGSIIQIQMMGDEYLHWAETSDGFTVISDQEGFMTLAIQDKAGDLIASKIKIKPNGIDSYELKLAKAKIKPHASFSKAQVEKSYAKSRIKRFKNASTNGKQPVVGKRRFLVILMQTTDVKFQKSQEKFRSLMNDVGYEGDGNAGSVHDFYYENSFGQLDLQCDVTPVYTASHNMAYYGNNTDGNPCAIAKEAITAASDDYNLADYDADGDGYLDGVHIVFAGHGEEAGGGNDCIWSHQATTSGYFCMADGIKMNKYSCSPELRGSSGKDMTYIGVICHEIGHVLGTMDFYDTNYGTGGQYPGTGKWDLMASGNWNGNGASPAHFNPYSKIYDFGWSDVQNGNVPATKTLHAKTKGDFVRIDTQTEGEYFLLEYRNKSGFDVSLPGQGLMVYHASDDLSRRLGNTINATHKQQFYPLCANSTYILPTSMSGTYGDVNVASTPFPGTLEKTQLTDATTPSMKDWTENDTRFPITNIIENAPSAAISFTIAGGVNGSAYDFQTEQVTLNSISLTWKVPEIGKKILVQMNETGKFGTLTKGSDLTEGQLLSDGSTVAYIGIGTTCSLSGLKKHTTYSMRINTWSEEEDSWISGSTLFARTLTDVIDTFPYEDNFDTQNLDAAWEEEAVIGAGHRWNVSIPHENETGWVLKFTPELFAHQASRLILPIFDFSRTNTAMISFDYRNWISSLQVQYKSSSEDKWEVLAELDNNYQTSSSLDAFMKSETHVDIPLPSLTDTYQLALYADFSPRGSIQSLIEVATVDNLCVSANFDIVVITQSPSFVGAKSAVVPLEVFEGMAGKSSIGVSWSTNGSSWTKTESSAAKEVTLKSLTPNTTYYYRTYAVTNEGATVYGETKSFTTLNFSNGTGTEKDPILISSTTEWKKIATCVSGGNALTGIHFRLTNSLVSPAHLEGVFSGILDGNGKTIGETSSTYVSYYIKELGSRGVIKNLNPTSGPLINKSYGTVHDCKADFSKAYSKTGGMEFGMIAQRNYGTIYSCDVNMDECYIEQGYVGGICGWNFGTILRCTFTGLLAGNNNSTIGGIAGMNYYQSTADGVSYGLIQQCTNNGSIEIRLNSESSAWWNCAGGICGTSYGTVKECINKGTITAACSNTNTNNVAGGIVGRLQHQEALLSDCLNHGTIMIDFKSDNDDYAGGIVGDGYLSSMYNCLNAGSVIRTVGTNVHDLLGNNNQTIVTNCYYINKLGDTYGVAVSSADLNSESLVALLNGSDAGGVWCKGSERPCLVWEKGGMSVLMFGLSDYKPDGLTMKALCIGGKTISTGFEWKKYSESEWTSCATSLETVTTFRLQGLEPGNRYTCRAFARDECNQEVVSPSFVFATEFSEAGLPSDPILLSSLDHMETLKQLVHQGNTFDGQLLRLKSDINMQGDKGYLWTPIQDGGNRAFSGELDGNGYALYNLYIKDSSSSTGLFGTTYICYIHDLAILNGTIISDVDPSTNGYHGGVGAFIGSEISFGGSDHPLVERCSFQGTISGGNRTGGLVGAQAFSGTAAKDSYVVGDIGYHRYGTATIGGIVGEGNAENCYFAGTFTISNTMNYKLNGTTTSGTATNCYDCSSADGKSISHQGLSLSNSQFTDGTLLSYLPSDIWQADNDILPVNYGYPVISMLSGTRILTIGASKGTKGILLKGKIIGGDKTCVVAGFEYCYGEGETQTIMAAAINEFSATIDNTQQEQLRFRAFGKENESTTLYGEWIVVSDSLLPDDPDGESHTLGDANNDGSIDVGDFTAIAGFIMGAPPATFVEKAADVNGDAEINVGDLTAVARLILYGMLSTYGGDNTKTGEGISTTVIVNDCEVQPGYEFTIDVDVNSAFTFSGYQFDIVIPEGISVKQTEGHPCAWLSTERTNAIRTNYFESAVMQDGQLRLLAASTKEFAFEGTEGSVARITFVVDKNLPAGDYQININHIVLASDCTLLMPNASSFNVRVGESTGISNLIQDTNGEVYDILGRKLTGTESLNRLGKGVYILNGKKIIK